MPKITSRQDLDDASISRLQDLVTLRAIPPLKSHGITKPASILNELVEQTALVMASIAETVEALQVDLAFSRLEAARLEVKVDELESVVENLLADVSYDEALDHAAQDLMDGLASSGAADATADGEIAFDERVVLNKEDLKPYLQQAIIRWIEGRLAG